MKDDNLKRGEEGKRRRGEERGGERERGEGEREERGEGRGGERERGGEGGERGERRGERGREERGRGKGGRRREGGRRGGGGGGGEEVGEGEEGGGLIKCMQLPRKCLAINTRMNFVVFILARACAVPPKPLVVVMNSASMHDQVENCIDSYCHCSGVYYRNYVDSF